MDDYFEALEDEFYAGNKMALLEAIRWICTSNAPIWVQEEFKQALDRYKSGDSRELGAAFGIERPKNWKQTDVRNRLKYEGDILRRMYELKRENVSEQSSREILAQEFPVTAHTIKTWWYEHKRLSTQNDD